MFQFVQWKQASLFKFLNIFFQNLSVQFYSADPWVIIGRAVWRILQLIPYRPYDVVSLWFWFWKGSTPPPLRPRPLQKTSSKQLQWRSFHNFESRFWKGFIELELPFMGIIKKVFFVQSKLFFPRLESKRAKPRFVSKSHETTSLFFRSTGCGKSFASRHDCPGPNSMKNRRRPRQRFSLFDFFLFLSQILIHPL